MQAEGDDGKGGTLPAVVQLNDENNRESGDWKLRFCRSNTQIEGDDQGFKGEVARDTRTEVWGGLNKWRRQRRRRSEGD